MAEMALTPTARIIDRADLKEASNKMRAKYRRSDLTEPNVNDEKYGFLVDDPEGRALYAREMKAYQETKALDDFNLDLMHDEGRVATMLGYDAIRVTGKGVPIGEEYYVIMNRAALAVVG